MTNKPILRGAWIGSRNEDKCNFIVLFPFLPSTGRCQKIEFTRQLHFQRKWSKIKLSWSRCLWCHQRVIDRESLGEILKAATSKLSSHYYLRGEQRKWERLLRCLHIFHKFFKSIQKYFSSSSSVLDEEHEMCGMGGCQVAAPFTQRILCRGGASSRKGTKAESWTNLRQPALMLSKAPSQILNSFTVLSVDLWPLVWCRKRGVVGEVTIQSSDKNVSLIGFIFEYF